MNEEEKKAIANFKYWIDTNTERGICYLPDYICAKVLNLIEKLQKQIEELESYLYSANCIIDDYIDERNKLKNKMTGDKMEQFDDYIIYLIESYLKILGE